MACTLRGLIISLILSLAPAIGMLMYRTFTSSIMQASITLLPLGTKTKLTSHVRYFDNSASSDKLYGEIDSKPCRWEPSSAMGSTVWFRLSTKCLGKIISQLWRDGCATYLVNWSVTTFTNAKEKSWNVSYGYDFAALGLRLECQCNLLCRFWYKVGGKTNQDEQRVELIVNYTDLKGNSRSRDSSHVHRHGLRLEKRFKRIPCRYGLQL